MKNNTLGTGIHELGQTTFGLAQCQLREVALGDVLIEDGCAKYGIVLVDDGHHRHFNPVDLAARVHVRSPVGHRNALTESLFAERHGVVVVGSQNFTWRESEDGLFVAPVKLRVVFVGVHASERMLVVRNHGGYRIGKIAQKSALAFSLQPRLLMRGGVNPDAEVLPIVRQPSGRAGEPLFRPTGSGWTHPLQLDLEIRALAQPALEALG